MFYVCSVNNLFMLIEASAEALVVAQKTSLCHCFPIEPVLTQFSPEPSGLGPA
jgi:hypothetical protein